MENSIENGKSVCPFCGDMYFCDNISPDIPPYMDVKSVIIDPCGHQFSVDFVGDIKFCPVCRGNAKFDGGLKFKDWQDSIVERLI
jgi:RNA polymerase subunit RPABC4/transcription elongation factor Spt4